MAYGELYRFVFEAANGPEVTISVAKKDYTGAVSSRAVGGSAVLKRERSGHILGSSLEWAAECLVEEEFADLYTSDPTLYQVTVKFGASRVWRGFITPELYSAPWVNTPYDVTLTASDNLSELKNFDFEEQGDKTVRELLLLLLDKTNQGITNITAISSLSGDGESLINLTVNVDAKAGNSYYDVLDGLLESLHAYIRLDAGTLSWVVLRETDVSNYSGMSYIGLSSLAGSGKMFPSGNLSVEIVPAHKELTVSEEIHAANVAKTFDRTNVKTLRDTPTWGTSEYGATVDLTTRPYWALTEQPERIDSIAGVLFTKLASGRRYTLTFRAKNSGFSVGKTLLKWGLAINNGSVMIYYNESGGYSVTYPGNDYPIGQELSTEFAEYTYTFTIPEKVGSSAFVPSQGSFSARCVREGDGSTVWEANARLADVRLSVCDFPDGLATRVILDNSARTAGDEVTLQFGADMAQARLNAIQEKKFTSAAITTAQDFNAFMAIDNALSVATPRLRLSGIVMFKTAAAWRLPEFIRTTHTTADNLDYIVEQYSFNLITGEIDLTMLSLPAVSLSYTELITSNVYGQSSGGSGGSGSGGSGGSGAPGAAAGFDTPEATAEAVDGTTPTASVTTSGPDTKKKFVFKFGIPKAAETLDNLARLQTAPKLVIVWGADPEQREIDYLHIWHPLLTSASGYEAVLMVYRRKNSRKTAETNLQKFYKHKKGWAVALGNKSVTEHSSACTAAGNSGIAIISMTTLRDFIVKRFCHDTAYTAAELFGRTYEQWAAVKRATRGFVGGSGYLRFGIAVRCVNPAFTALLDSSKTLSPTTQEIGGVPRYIYSMVSTLDAVFGTSVAGQKNRDRLFFGVSG
jgi:hypothetical protein|nr:MAG TPA: Transcription initiation factor TFIID subunit, DNA, Nuclear [Caudoviricetes sp.]